MPKTNHEAYDIYDFERRFAEKYARPRVKDPKYEGLRSCFRNVTKCNYSKKLAYCKG